jgi:hypothetical protein
MMCNSAGRQTHKGNQYVTFPEDTGGVEVVVVVVVVTAVVVPVADEGRHWL